MTIDKDQFINTLIAQYKDDIEEALVECEHVYRSTIDYELLHEKIEQVLNSAIVDGLPEKMIWELIQTRIPSYVNYLNSKGAGKKAA